MSRSLAAPLSDRLAWLLALAVASSACASSHEAGDSGSPDAPSDAAVDSTSSDAGEVDAGPQVGCEGWAPDGLRACVPAGPFRFGMVVEASLCSSCTEDYLQQRRATAEDSPFGDLAHSAETEAFLIDLREVSIVEYAEYVMAVGVDPPPVACEHPHYPYLGCSEISTPTGWGEDGTPLPDWLDLPATCVTQTEAEAFCTWRGGYLPDTVEWMKAARGPSPNNREYPWSEDEPAAWAPGANLPYGWVAHVAEPPPGDFCDHIADLRRPDPVDSHHQAASPYGLLNVVGNAAEWVRTAASGDNYERLGIDVVSGPFTSESPFGDGEGGLSWGVPQISTGMSAVVQLDPERSGAVLRERTLGFRCAYPAE